MRGKQLLAIFECAKKALLSTIYQAEKPAPMHEKKLCRSTNHGAVDAGDLLNFIICYILTQVDM
jgi:hypothetical protein